MSSRKCLFCADMCNGLKLRLFGSHPSQQDKVRTTIDVYIARPKGAGEKKVEIEFVTHAHMHVVQSVLESNAFRTCILFSDMHL